MAEMLSRSLHALSDATRRAILLLLQERELPAGEIGAHFPISAPSVSHHLAVLKNAGLVRAERRGQSILYSRDAAAMQALLDELCVTFGRAVLRGNPRDGEVPGTPAIARRSSDSRDEPG